jgi:hypothetical protein
MGQVGFLRMKWGGEFRAQEMHGVKSDWLTNQIICSILIVMLSVWCLVVQGGHGDRAPTVNGNRGDDD